MAADNSARSAYPWSWLATAAIVGLVVRLVFSFAYWTHQPLTRDELEYLSLARSLAAGHGFVYDEAMLTGSFVPFGRAPGYPAFLAAIGAGGDVVTEVPATVKIAQSVVGAIGVVLVGVIACRLGGPRAGRAASAIAAVYPPLVWVAARVFSESLFWPAGLAIAWVFDRALERDNGTRDMAVAGVLTGLAVLVRPALIIFVALAAVWLLMRRRPALAAVLVVGSLAVIGPWTARNYLVHHRLVLVASDGGITFWTGNNAVAIGEGDLAANPDMRRAERALRAQYPGLSEEQMEPIYYREALAWMRAHPGAWMSLELRKFFYLIVPIGPSYTLHSSRFLIASVVSYGAVATLAIMGWFRLGAGRRRATGVWLLALASVAVCLIFFPQERFRLPSIDPALVVLAGAAWTRREPGA